MTFKQILKTEIEAEILRFNEAKIKLRKAGRERAKGETVNTQPILKEIEFRRQSVTQMRHALAAYAKANKK